MPIDKPGQCRDCQQGYTVEGYAAYPDHIKLCPRHAVLDELLRAAKASLPFYEVCDDEDALKIAAQLRAAIAKTEKVR